MTRSAVRRLWRWLWSPTTVDRRRRPIEWWTCPQCGRDIVGDDPPGGMGYKGRFSRIPPTAAEITARCPEHGRPPYNVPESPGPSSTSP